MKYDEILNLIASAAILTLVLSKSVGTVIPLIILIPVIYLIVDIIKNGNREKKQYEFGGIEMIRELMYMELKTGYSDDGPAWIGYVKTSKTRKTIYFNDHAFQKYHGGCSNYVDIENGDEYWISGLKKKESNRHWAGHGKIMIDRRAVNEYLALIGEKELSLNLFEIIDIEDCFPVERVNKLLNETR